LSTEGYLLGMLNQVTQTSAAGEPQAIAGLLSQVAPTFQDLGRRDLHDRLGQVADALHSGDFGRTDWIRSRLYGEISQIQDALQAGASCEDAFIAATTAPTLGSITAPSEKSFIPPAARTHLGPPPRIRWEQFGSEKHPAPNPPSAAVTSAGKRLAYFAQYVAGISGHGESEQAVEDFFDISGHMRRRLRDGFLIPANLGHFPTEDARSLIRTSSDTEPKYGQLMLELVVQAFFESQAWSLGLPTETAPWHVGLLYALRRHVGHRLLCDSGRKEVFEDKPLLRIVQGKVSLNQVNWYGRRTRREIFESWIRAMSPHNARRIEQQRRSIGDGVLRMKGWKEPPANAGEDLLLQWMVRCWIAYHHYGAIPAAGLPFPPEQILKFALAVAPGRVAPQFREGLLRMMGQAAETQPETPEEKP
jgi:hypothetical protein